MLLKKNLLLLVFGILMFTIGFSQQAVRRCGTMEVLNKQLKDPAFKAEFEANREKIFKNIKQNGAAKSAASTIVDTIPVVVHIVMANPNLVTDATVQSQLDVLNEDYQGKNADTTRLPAAFKALFGRGGITFMLAKTAPDGLPTTGIERRTNAITFNDATYNNAKHNSTGGIDGWNSKKYFNMWVVDFGNSGLLGISVFPGTPGDPNEHGYLCGYDCFGRGPSYLNASYNKGRTATHEIGHFFNLFHIWGDDIADSYTCSNNAAGCAGADFTAPFTAWDDTPNQCAATDGNPDASGTGTVKTDYCSTTAPGIMYQNYMDYSYDIALAMFTTGQWKVIDYILTNAPDRAPILNSDAYNPPPNKTYDAGTPVALSPVNNAYICGNSLPSSQIKLYNYAASPLTSANVYVKVNGGSPTLIQSWTGSLAQYATATLTLPQIALTTGANTITYYTSLPNGNADENNNNDSVTIIINSVQISAAQLPAAEGFESTFPNTNWTVRNPDGGTTWAKSTAAKTGTGSVKMDFFNSDAIGQYDYIVSPMLNFTSATLSFDYAYRTYSGQDLGDSLAVVVSTDCGNTWTVAGWNKGGTTLRTVTGNTTASFTPTAAQWTPNTVVTTSPSVSLNAYANQYVYIALRARTGYSNNLYLDNVNITGVFNTLPLQLSYFKGIGRNKTTNQLDWATLTETNTAYFSIEKSINGTEFSEIAQIVAKGNSTVTTPYGYSDYKVTTDVTYYRLKMIDKDGKSTYSSIVSIKLIDKAVNTVSIYPNPVKNVLFVNIQADVFKQTTVQITDLQGRILSTQNITLQVGNNSTSIDASKLPKGMYMLVINGIEKQALKFNKD